MPDAELRQVLAKRLRQPHEARPERAAYRGIASRLDISDRLKEIDLPVFVTCGRYDETTPSHLEEPDAYFEAVETFLAPAESSG